MIEDKRAELKFQFTHPVRGATVSPFRHCKGRSFQFTHPVRGATVMDDILGVTPPFQFTHPVRGATDPRGCPACPRGCFNSRTP